MDDNKLRFGVGVLVIASIGIGIILTFLFGAFPTVLSSEYTITAKFDSAAGVSTNTPVLRDGVKIGRVTKIELIENENSGGVKISLAIDEKYKFTHRYVPRIGVGSVITGDAVVEFVRIDNPMRLEEIYREDSDLIPVAYKDGDYTRHGLNAEDPFNLLFGLESQVKQTIQNVNMLANDFRQTVGNTDTRIDNVSKEAEATLKELQLAGVGALKEFQGAMQDLRAIVGNPAIKSSVQDAAAALPDVIREAQQTLQSTQRTFKSFEKVGEEFEGVGEVAGVVAKDIREITKKANTTVDKVNDTVDTAKATIQGAGKTLKTIEGTFKAAERTVHNVERFSEPLARRSDEIVEQVVQSLKSVDRALAEVETLGATLNNDNGSIQRLIKDEEIYWQLRRTIANVEQASSRIKPILDDVRIFTDKVARDPRQLGVRGAITRRPNGTGLK